MANHTMMEHAEGAVPKRSDRDLVLAFKAGERAAYEEMYARYRLRVYGVCVRILRHPQDAEEASQETFLRAFQALHRFNGRYQLGAWLARIAANTSVDQLRSKSRAPVVALPENQDPVVDEPGPEDIVAGGHPRLEHAIAEVKPLHAQALALRALEGLSHQEIADQLALTPAQVKALLHRARSSLRKAMDRVEGWLLAPVVSLRALLGDRSNGNAAGSPFVGATTTLTPVFAERVAATAFAVVVALSGLPSAPDTTETATKLKPAPHPTVEARTALAPAGTASEDDAATPAVAMEAEGDVVAGIPRLIEETLNGHEDIETEEDPPPPSDEGQVPTAASSTAQDVLREARQLLPHGGPNVPDEKR